LFINIIHVVWIFWYEKVFTFHFNLLLFLVGQDSRMYVARLPFPIEMLVNWASTPSAGPCCVCMAKSRQTDLLPLVRLVIY
jgi:hypothetical protein